MQILFLTFHVLQYQAVVCQSVFLQKGRLKEHLNFYTTKILRGIYFAYNVNDLLKLSRLGIKRLIFKIHD